jgi:plasmid maintenance system antidote protein VapI
MLLSILAGRSAVSPEMAVRLGKFCDNGAGFWLRMQDAHDLWHAEQKLRDELRKISPARCRLTQASRGAPNAASWLSTEFRTAGVAS